MYGKVHLKVEITPINPYNDIISFFLKEFTMHSLLTYSLQND